MGHKVQPRIHRTQVIYTWDSRWYSKNSYAMFARQDLKIREYLETKFKEAGVSSIAVERSAKNMTVTVFVAKPGMIIGKGGQGLDEVRKYIERQILQHKLKVKLNVREVRSPALSANLVAQSIVADIEKRLPFRRAMKSAMERVMKAGGKGIKIVLSGRLNGAEIARTEKMHVGTVPLITLRSDVEFCSTAAQTLQGKIGVKVWICHGEVFGRKDILAESAEAERREATNNRRNERGQVRPAEKLTSRVVKK